ncbi:hypothetical protein L9F63_005289, partial [Diploptera punctata]
LTILKINGLNVNLLSLARKIPVLWSLRSHIVTAYVIDIIKCIFILIYFGVHYLRLNCHSRKLLCRHKYNDINSRLLVY